MRRTVYHEVPPRVEYSLTDWGQALCPALDALLKWAVLRDCPPAAKIRSSAGDREAIGTPTT